MAIDPVASDLYPILYRERRRVTMHETDASGLIFFGVVSAWANEGFCGWLAAAGHSLSSLLQASVAFPTRRFESEYLAPLALDDEVEIQLRAVHVGRTSFALGLSTVRLHDSLIAVTATTWHVYAEFAAVGPGRRPQPRSEPLPGWLIEALAG